MRKFSIKTAFLVCLLFLFLTVLQVRQEDLSEQLPAPYSGKGCTSFYLNSGAGVYGTNFDSDYSRGQIFANTRGIEKSGMESGSSGKKARWTSKYGSLTCNLGGYQLPWAGMNEAGLIISTMALAGSESPAADERTPLFSPFWVQFLLDTCASVEEVIAQQRWVRIKDTVDHFMVADMTGNCAVIEFIGGRMVVHTGRTLAVCVLTNNIYEYSVLAWMEKRAQGESLKRFITAADKVDVYTPSGTRPPEKYAFSVLSLTADHLLTKWSIVFDQKNLRVSYFTKQNRSIRTIDLKEMDFSAQTPVKMLDIDVGVTGDVTSTMGPYSHDAAFSHMSDALKVFAPGVTESLIQEMLAFFEHFRPIESPH